MDALIPDHARIESLGDNCELGFLLRRMGNESGSLFRWASMKPDKLLLMLRDGLETFYRFDRLQPLHPAMVLDTAYGIGWHSDLHSHRVGGAMEFVEAPGIRARIHAREERKQRYLVAKLRARLRLGGVLFVVKCNAGIPGAVLDGIHGALLDMAGGTPVTLLEVQDTPDASLAGTAVERRPGLLRGWVPRFAPYTAAHDMDVPAWTGVLSAALALAPCPDWAQRHRQMRVDFDDGGIHLPLPPPRGMDWSKPVMGDLRGGAVRLIGGNEWCRPVPGAYRLHGPAPGLPPAELRWVNVHGDGARVLSGLVRCAVADSVPVDLVVEAADAARAQTARQVLQVAPGRTQEVFVPITPERWPLDLRITARAARPLAPGERAVVDLSGLALFPHAPALAAAA